MRSAAASAMAAAEARTNATSRFSSGQAAWIVLMATPSAASGTRAGKRSRQAAGALVGGEQEQHEAAHER